ncbi:MAG: LD-carboxypeptidase [Burkholderiaceae bacterium]
MKKTRRIGMVAPSGRLPNEAEADRAARFFTRRGWQVLAGESVFEHDTRFAGPDDLRASELQSFATDPRIDVVLSARGGYGITRLLHRFDYRAIAERAPILVGYSDFTAFNLAYLAQAGGVSFQGPSAVDFAREAPQSETVEQFFAAIENAEHEVSFATEAPPLTVRGTLWGGNLAMVNSLLGTPYFPHVKGGILFLEDVNEPAYKVERMLLQLHQAGILEAQRAIVLGAFEPMAVMASDYGFEMTEVLARLMAATATPIITGLPFGHVPKKAMLAVGADARLSIKGGLARLSFSGYPNLA